MSSQSPIVSERVAAYLIGLAEFDGQDWAEQLEFLGTAEEGVAVRTILSTMNARRLFDTCLVSQRHFDLVSNYLGFLRNHDLDEAELSDDGSDCMESVCTEHVLEVASDYDHDIEGFRGFHDMPPEIGLQVLRDLALAERVGLSGASKPGAALVAEALQAAAVRVLAPFKLRFSDIRLLLTATGSIISGSVVAALAKSGATFEPADLDFLCANRGGQTAVHFLERAGHYKCVRHSEYTFAAGIGRIWTLFNDEGKKINVIESLTPNPFDAVGNFHLTCVYGAWGANGLLHGYPALTAAGDAITTRAKFPIRVGRRHERETWDVIHKYSDRGFRIHLNEYRERHTCGVDWNCPATIRRTDDAGCSYSPFPAWIYDDDAVKMPVSSWTMYGRGCRMGVLAGRFGAVDRASNINDGRWEDRVLRLMRMSDRPPVWP